MYYYPIKYICDECGFVVGIPPQHTDPIEAAPLFSEDGNPFCRVCLIKFITANVPVMHVIPTR